MWYTVFNRPPTVASVGGDGSVATRALEVQPDGSKVLVKKGRLDLYEMIQSHADSVDLEKMIARYNSGDPTALHRRDGVYIDVSEMPQTYAEWQQRFMDVQHVFDRLPIEIKEQYDHDVGQFMADVGSPAFFEKVERYSELKSKISDRAADHEDHKDKEQEDVQESE